WVDYSTVTALKMAALRLAWKGFSQRDDEQMAAFRQFVMQEGESLYWQAAFDALHAYQVKEDEMRWGWPVWPDAYQSVDTPEVKAFCEKYSDEVDFYLWLQWLAYS
ncbi:4-alpha-glucanotransferase, partial [Raoultella ornithinolytica]|uniref:4-alpha-glucanotransferase n=1 Tax=Raoultella ornithinolytica TaxID=54291 RepID=UPI003F19D204